MTRSSLSPPAKLKRESVLRSAATEASWVGLFGLLHRRECLLPTMRGWVLIFAMLVTATFGAVRGVYSFLALEESIPGGVLVTEGWTPDHALAQALTEFRRHPYLGIWVTGLPMERGAILSEYQTFADLSAATLIRLGADPQTVHAVPAAAVQQDRTYATALALREELRRSGISAEKVNIVSLGAHARRTRLLFEKAFGPGTRIGIIAVPHRDFEPSRWWQSSQGFRTITGEVIAYVYAILAFHPDPNAARLE